MAKVDLHSMNAELDAFIEKTKFLKITKDDVTSMIEELLRGIAVFDRLKSLYDSIEDDNDPRKQNYYNLAQEIAGPSGGWQRSQQLLARESTLADRGDFTNRLTEEEIVQVGKLVRSGSLEKFDQLINMDTPDLYDDFRSLVMTEGFVLESTNSNLTALLDNITESAGRIDTTLLNTSSSLSRHFALLQERMDKQSEYMSEKERDWQEIDEAMSQSTSKRTKPTLLEEESKQESDTRIQAAVDYIVKASKAVEDSTKNKGYREKPLTALNMIAKPQAGKTYTRSGLIHDMGEILKFVGIAVASVGGLWGVSEAILKAQSLFGDKFEKIGETISSIKTSVKGVLDFLESPSKDRAGRRETRLNEDINAAKGTDLSDVDPLIIQANADLYDAAMRAGSPIGANQTQQGYAKGAMQPLIDSKNPDGMARMVKNREAWAKENFEGPALWGALAAAQLKDWLQYEVAGLSLPGSMMMPEALAVSGDFATPEQKASRLEQGRVQVDDFSLRNWLRDFHKFGGPRISKDEVERYVKNPELVDALIAKYPGPAYSSLDQQAGRFVEGTWDPVGISERGGVDRNAYPMRLVPTILKNASSFVPEAQSMVSAFGDGVGPGWDMGAVRDADFGGMGSMARATRDSVLDDQKYEEFIKRFVAAYREVSQQMRTPYIINATTTAVNNYSNAGSNVSLRRTQ